MRLLPVLDIKDGKVVRGIAGRRELYKPIQSALTPSHDPVPVAEAIHKLFGNAAFYLADLDAIAGKNPCTEVYRSMQAIGVRLWVDAGVTDSSSALPLIVAGVDTIVLGLETIRGPEVVSELSKQVGRDRVALSLDLCGGHVLASNERWKAMDALAIAEEVIGLGVRRMIVLDLSRVGLGEGTGTVEVCRKLVRTYPEVEIIAGGGIGTIEDWSRLERAGVHAALVASALHDGRLSPTDLRESS